MRGVSMRTSLIVSSWTILFCTGARGIEGSNQFQKRGPNRVIIASHDPEKQRQHPEKTGIVKPWPGINRMWLSFFGGALGSILLLAELLRRAPEGYEDNRGFHFAKATATTTRRRPRRRRLSHSRRRKRVPVGWLIPVARSFSSTH